MQDKKLVFKGSFKEISAKYPGYWNHEGYGSIGPKGNRSINNYGVSTSHGDGHGLLYGHMIPALKDFKPHLAIYFSLAGAMVRSE